MFHAVLCLLRNDILFETNSNIATCNVISVLPDVSDKGTFLVLSEREREEKHKSTIMLTFKKCGLFPAFRRLRVTGVHCSA